MPLDLHDPRFVLSTPSLRPGVQRTLLPVFVPQGLVTLRSHPIIRSLLENLTGLHPILSPE